MARPNRVPWIMNPEQRALLPEVSGNAINGLGEREPRRPRIVYWPNDASRESGTVSKHPFGPVIAWFRRMTPAVMRVYTDFAHRAPKTLAPVTETRVQDTPENWTRRVKEFVLEHEGHLVGITRLNPDWFFDDAGIPDLPWVVMIGCRMDYDKMQHMPPSTGDPVAAIEVGETYNKVDRAAGALANWVRSQGWYAENQGGPNSGRMLLIPPAIECGFGELGKHGSIINRRYGSLIRLSAVRTCLPMVPDSRDEFGADDFCTRCQVCTRACPVDAIYAEKQLVRGTVKWYVDFDKCVPYFNENYACGICIAVCPWSRPGVAPRLAERLPRRDSRPKDRAGATTAGAGPDGSPRRQPGTE
ncbi:MAG: 4Fe-4S dicluster domain-containing protein [Gammaproteobacteria bacterium]